MQRDDVTPTTTKPDDALRSALPLSPATLIALLVLSTALFLVFPSPLWRAGRGEGHLLRFVVSYFAVAPVAAALLWRRRTFRFDALVTVVALIWGAKLVVTSLLYQLVGPSRGADLHTPTSNEPAPVAAASALGSSVLDAVEVSTLVGRIVAGERPVAGAVVSVCNAASGGDAAPVDRATSIVAGAVSPSLVDATLGDQLTIDSADAAPHAVHGVAAGLSAFSLAVVPGRRSSQELTTLGSIPLEVDGIRAGTLLVFDHPLHARTDRDGQFVLRAVPVGPCALCVYVGATPAPLVVHTVVGGSAPATFDLGSAS